MKMARDSLFLLVFSLTCPFAFGQYSENFESFSLGPLGSQSGWSTNSAQTQIVDTGIPGFGSRSIVHDESNQPFYLDLRSPDLNIPYGVGLFWDLTITANPIESFKIKPWDLAAGIQNTILRFNGNGTIDAFQLDTAPAGGIGYYEPTSAAWTVGKKMRLGVVVSELRSGGPFSVPSLKFFVDGVEVYRGVDMAQESPFSILDSGIGQLRIEGNDSFILDNISNSMFVPAGPDFNQDGHLDIDDLDDLIAAIVSPGNRGVFDVTGDGVVNLADRDEWLSVAGAANLSSGNAYLLGDANLDGTVDGEDFLSWNGGKFSDNGNWSNSDFNADGVTDGSDFLIWNQNKFSSADVRTVPEPGVHVMYLGLMALLVLRREEAIR
jgi:hypothetical protein